MNVEATADALSHLADQLGFFSRTATIRDITQLMSLSNQFRSLDTPASNLISQKHGFILMLAGSTWHSGQRKQDSKKIQ